MAHPHRLQLTFFLCALAATCACGSSSPAPTTPTAPVTVPPVVTPSAITISGQLSFSASGQSSQLAAKATYADGTVRDFTTICTWMSTNPDVAVVSETGLLTARTAGTTYVSATRDGRTGYAIAAVRALDLPAETALTAQILTGPWRNVDPNTGGVTHLEIRVEGDTFAVRAWGACSPTDCDWGETTTALADGNDGILSLTWHEGPIVETVELRLLKDGRLEFWCHTRFNDNSGRPDYDSSAYLRTSGALTVSSSATGPPAVSTTPP